MSDKRKTYRFIDIVYEFIERKGRLRKGSNSNIAQLMAFRVRLFVGRNNNNVKIIKKKFLVLVYLRILGFLAVRGDKV